MSGSMTPFARSERALAATDLMDAGLKQCVHEYGYAIVYACVAAGVRAPKRIHLLVREIWEGARQPRQKREPLGTLDWLLLQAGAEINASTLARILAANNLAIVSTQPTRVMVEASEAQVSGFNVRCTRYEKHRRRLMAAIAAGAKELRPKALVGQLDGHLNSTQADAGSSPVERASSEAA